MPRENSISDDGRSLTPDLPEVDDTVPQTLDPTRTETPFIAVTKPSGIQTVASAPDGISTRPPVRPTFDGAAQSDPLNRFRASVQKVIRLHRSTSILDNRTDIGAEPGVDPRRETAFLAYGHLRQNWCVCEAFLVHGGPLNR